MRWSLAVGALTLSTSSLRLVRIRAMSSTASLQRPPGALLFLHGLGDTPAGWEDTIREELPRIHPQLASLVYRFPHAPTIPISINGGAKMTGWFDLYDWPIDTSAPEDRTQVPQSVALLKTEIRSIMQAYNLPAHKIVVGGFSQGGAIALVAAYHAEYGAIEEEALGGCVNLSGWWPLQPPPNEGRATTTPAQQGVPLFWGHGKYDDKVLFEHQAFGVQLLKEQLGVQQIEARQYSIGHSSDPDELRDVADFVQRVIFGGASETAIPTTTSSSIDKEL